MGGQAALGLIWESFNARCKQINLPPDLLGGLSPVQLSRLVLAPLLYLTFNYFHIRDKI